MGELDRKSRKVHERLLKRVGLWALRNQPCELIKQLRHQVASDASASVSERVTPRNVELRRDRKKLLGMIESEDAREEPKMTKFTIIAKTFLRSVRKLSSNDITRIAGFVEKLQENPASPGLGLERIQGAMDPHMWSARVNRDLRAILHHRDDEQRGRR